MIKPPATFLGASLQSRLSSRHPQPDQPAAQCPQAVRLSSRKTEKAGWFEVKRKKRKKKKETRNMHTSLGPVMAYLAVLT